MRRILLSGLFTAAVATSAIVAHASLLSVDAGVLQTLTHEIDPGDIVIPDSARVTISVTVIRFNSGNGKELGGGRNTVTQDIPLGSSYTILWDGGPVVPCNSVSLTNPPAGSEGSPGTYTALADATQYFCVQTGGGTLSIAEGGPAGTASTTTAMPVESEDALEGDRTTTLDTDTSSPSSSLDHAAGDRCLDDGWRGRTGPDGAPYESEQECVEGEEAAYQERLGASSGDAG